MLVPKKVDEGGQQFGEQVLAAYQASPTRVKDHLGQLPEPEISMLTSVLSGPPFRVLSVNKYILTSRAAFWY